MDNVCHTLVGAACVRAGFTRPAPLAMATSIIAANLPDVDVLVFATDVPSVAFRRGWTHGVLAQAALPLLLAGAMFAIARARRRANGPAAELGPLLALSYLGVVLHVGLDCLNNYGVRLLMPFSNRWFYGDTLFIVDPWLWLAFGAAVVLGRGGRTRTSRLCVAVAAAYIVAMIGSARAAKAAVLDELTRQQGAPPRGVMAGPVPITPLRKAVIVDWGREYRTGTFTWHSQRLSLAAPGVAKGDEHPAVEIARQDPRVAGILVWSRFPFWTVDETADGYRVTVRDMRFAAIGRGGFSATTIVPRAAATPRP